MGEIMSFKMENHIIGKVYDLTQRNMNAMIAECERLQKCKASATEIKNLKRTHRSCADEWYSCPKSEDGCADDEQGEECNCGADEHNAKVDDLIQKLN